MIIKMLRINIALTFSGMFKGSRSAKKRGVMAKIGIGALAVCCVGAFALGFGTMFMRICEPFYEMELGWLYFAMVGITAFALCFIGSVFMAST